MKIQRIYNCGKVINPELYNRLKTLDGEMFIGCGNEFKLNRDWWVVVDKNKIIAYCGCLYSEGVCIFVRAWVYKKYRGRGLQRRMITVRLNAARKQCYTAITYTLANNIVSANNLIKKKFLLYEPAYKYSGKDVLYFKVDLQ